MEIEEDEMKKALEQEDDETLILWKEMGRTKEEHNEKIVANLHLVMRFTNYLQTFETVVDIMVY